MRLNIAMAHAVVCVLVLSVAPVHATSVTTVDDFSEGAVELTTTGPLVTRSQTGLDTDHVLFGNRTLELSSDGGDASIKIDQHLDDIASIESGTLVEGNASFIYESSGGYDLSSYERFDVEVFANDASGGTLGLQLQDTSGSLGFTNATIPSGSSTVAFSLNDLSGVNLTQTARVELAFDGVESQDVAFDEVGAVVPVPTSVWAGGVLLVVLAIGYGTRYQRSIRAA